MTSASDRGDFLARHGAALIDNGYRIVPIPRGTKGPHKPGWQNIQSTKPQLEKWLANGSAHDGVGILTKTTPAVDIDVRDAALSASMVQWVRENIGAGLIRIGEAPKTVLLFQTDTPFRKVTSAEYTIPDRPEAKKQRVEILGDGQQVVAYHIHPDTKKPYYWPYAFEGDEPLATPSFELVEITEAQAKAIVVEFERQADAAGWKRVKEANDSAPAASKLSSDESGDYMAEILPPDETATEIARVKSALDQISGDVVSAMSYDEWFAVMCSLKWLNWECGEELAREWSESSDGHTDDHFNRTWRGAGKQKRAREFTIGTLFHVAKQSGWEAPVSETTIKEELDALAALLDEVDFFSTAIQADQRFFKKIAKANLSITNEEKVLAALKTQTGVNLPVLRKELALAKKPDLGGSKPTHAGYAENLLKILEAKSGVEPVGVGGMVYMYDKERGVWDGRKPGSFVLEVASNFDGQERCERRTDYTAIANQTYDLAAQGNDDFFIEAPTGLACEGRFYRVDKDQIVKEALSSRHRQRILSPVRPVVGEMPIFTKFLDQTFAGDNGEQVNQLQEIVGAILVGVMYRYEKAVLFKGVGRSGKGTLLKIIEALVPPEARSAASPFKWDHEYYVAALAGKRLNVVGELPDDLPIPSAVFKSVTGRDTLTGRHPTHMPFTFTNEAAHLFNTNHFIHTKDHTEAFYSRFILFEFKNSRIDVENGIDADLADRIIAEELPAIAAWAMQGAKRLTARGKFTVTDAHKALLAQWQHRTSSLMEFLLDVEEVELKPNAYTRRRDFYITYSDWCRDSNRRATGKQRCFDDLNTQAVAKLGISNGMLHGYPILKGVSLRSMSHLSFDSDDDETL